MDIQTTINLKGNILDLTVPRVMGILNVTPDSFHSASRMKGIDQVLFKAEEMLSDGATFLDIGGYSSRPDAAEVSEEEEISRVTAPIAAIAERFPEAYISIDTFRSKVAQQAVEHGAHLVNDIAGGDLDADMWSTVAELNVPYILMHMRGTPQTMKTMTNYEHLVGEVAEELAKKADGLRQVGVKDVIIDPGFGFAKTLDQNYELMDNLDYLHHVGKPILVGISRKSMIYNALNIEPSEALNGTTVLNTVALLKGASILRVHDVKEAVETVKLTQKLAH